MTDPVPSASVRFSKVTKRFPGTNRRDLARAALPDRAPKASGTLALDDVDLEVFPGELLGVIGRNGAGKSTLLKTAAGILTPTTGTVTVRGIPTAMIELGFSFHPDLTGRENLPLAAGLAGVMGEELDDLTEEIVEFSGIGRFMDRPVKHLSTGMAARLGFAIAVHMPTDVLLVDEVLAVGDRSFQQKCVQRVRALAAEGVAVLFVSHGLGLVGQTCTRAICLDKGRVIDDGAVFDVIARYERNAAPLRTASGPPAARLTSLGVESDPVHFGEYVKVRCEVDVVDAAPRYELRSELTESGLPGAVNLDVLAPGVLGAPGHWELTTEIGPMVMTAGTLDLTVSLTSPADDHLNDLVHDHRRVPFTIVGEDVGVMRFAVDGTWEAIPSDQVAVTRSANRHRVITDPAVWCTNLTKAFSPRALEGPHRRHGGTDEPQLVAVDDLSFELGRGESLGLIGANGAGKSTLLRILAGVSGPTSGTAHVAGRVAAVLEVGAGFHRELTGTENLQFAWGLQGGDPADWDRARAAIEAFASIGPVLDRPVKHYSTGMGARLAIALALELHPEVLLLDEALSVGDIEFRERVRRRLRDVVEQGTTLICASHDLHLLLSMCDRVIRLDKGRAIDDGPAAEVIAAAGGSGWAGGSATAGGSIVLHEVRVPEVIKRWDPFTVELDVDVIRPSPDVAIEFSIRDHLADDTRAEAHTPEQVLILTLGLQRVRGIEQMLTTPGRWTLRGTIGGLPLMNRLDVVVSAIDTMDGTVVSEQWQTAMFGGVAASNARAELTWTGRLVSVDR